VPCSDWTPQWPWQQLRLLRVLLWRWVVTLDRGDCYCMAHRELARQCWLMQYVVNAATVVMLLSLTSESVGDCYSWPTTFNRASPAWSFTALILSPRWVSLCSLPLRTLTMPRTVVPSSPHGVVHLPPCLVAQTVGESERRLSQLFLSARRACPCILIFDQVRSGA
jgi:hypothetical protein